jgi:acetyl esterase/lipase
MSKWASVGVCVACMLLPSYAFAAKAKKRGQPKLKPPPNVELKRGIVYGKGGERDLKLDLFLPKDASVPRPAIVFIHGGGWRGGSPRQFHRQAAYLAGKGYVGACIEYRFTKEAKFPAALEDCKCAVRWFRCNAKTYNVDVDRIAVCGGSAGGHLAAMVGVTDASDGFEGKGGHEKQSSKVHLVVDFNGVNDLVDCAKKKMLSKAALAFLGASYDEAPKLYAKASPITYINAKSPPFLLLHGTNDKIVPFEQSVAVMKKLEALGIDAELYKAEGAGHGFFNRPPHYEPTLLRMEAFLDKHFRGAKKR